MIVWMLVLFTLKGEVLKIDLPSPTTCEVVKVRAIKSKVAKGGVCILTYKI